MVGADCQLEKLGKLPEFDSQVLAKCSSSSIGDEQFIHSPSALRCIIRDAADLPHPRRLANTTQGRPQRSVVRGGFLLHLGINRQ
jgi:hypothetical protein